MKGSGPLKGRMTHGYSVGDRDACRKSVWEHKMSTVIVTGVSRGLGLAIANRIAADGYKVVGMS